MELKEFGLPIKVHVETTPKGDNRKGSIFLGLFPKAAGYGPFPTRRGLSADNAAWS